MTPLESNEVAIRINRLNVLRTSRAEAAAGIVAAILLGVIAALALMAWGTPCEAGQLCMVAVVPTRTGIVARLVSWLRVMYLRKRIAWAESDLDVMQHCYETLPAQMASHRIWINHRRVQLMDAELMTRNH